MLGAEFAFRVAVKSKALIFAITVLSFQLVLSSPSFADGLSLMGVSMAAPANGRFRYSPQSLRAPTVINLTATAYSPGTDQNGQWNNKTYTGGNVGPGVVAVDPKVIPLGTKLYIPGYGTAIAGDTGGAIKGNKIDLGFSSKQAALNYGIKNVAVTILGR